MRILLPLSLSLAPGLADLAVWEAREAWPGLERGPAVPSRRDAFERVVGVEAPGEPAPDGPLRRAGAAILAYRIFPPAMVTPVLRRVPLRLGDTVGAWYHPLGAWLGGVFFASRVVEAFDGPDEAGRVWRVGFTYRTLEGHPVRGEETFSAEKDLATGEVLVALRSWSRLGHVLARAFEPAARLLQVRASDGALANLARAAAGGAQRAPAGRSWRRRLRAWPASAPRSEREPASAPRPEREPASPPGRAGPPGRVGPPGRAGSPGGPGPARPHAEVAPARRLAPGSAPRRFEDLTDVERAFNPTRTMAAACWVISARQDRFDDDTTWEIATWRVPSGEPIQTWYRYRDVSQYTGATEGAVVAGVAFVGDDTLEIRYRGREPERVTVPDQPPPPAADPDDPAPRRTEG